MDSLSVSYDRGTVPTILVSIGTASGQKLAGGDIDSGSDRSLIPLDYLPELGLKASRLKKNQQKGLAASGQRFDTWSMPGVALTGQVEIPTDGGFSAWGPIFRLRPYFADTGTLLLGQFDFFAAFDVHFTNQSGAPVFELCPVIKQLRGP